MGTDVSPELGRQHDPGVTLERFVEDFHATEIALALAGFTEV
jgi:hypothetical protein